MHRRLLAITRDARLPLLLTILAGLLAGFLTIAQAWQVSGTINGVFLDGQTAREAAAGLKLILVLIGGRALLAWLSEISANAVAVHIKTDLRERLLAHIFALGPAFTRRERTGELTTAAVEGIEALDAYYSQYLPQLVITALVPLSILIFVFPRDLISGVILLITAPLIPFFMVMIGKGAEAVTRRQYDTLRMLSAHFLDSLQGLTTLKIFGQSRSHAKNIAASSNRFRDVTLSVLRITFLSALVLELLATVSTAVIAVEIGLRLLYAKMEFREALFLLVLAPEFYMPLRMLGTRFHAGMAGTTAARRIFEILDIPLTEGNKQIFPLEMVDKTGEIILEDVSFTYPDEPEAALRNINLTIHSGQHIALVGASGAGKSTLASLLLGFIQPTNGRVVIAGNSRIAWVPQRPYLFHDTLAANIKFGKPDASLEEMQAAAKTAHLDEFIESLPDGYDTVIGEGAARLSGGQAQRLALARAFLMEAPILILDEPTSSLDPQTETLLDESIRVLMRGRTVITIAHRLNTIYQADQILFLEQGQITERGTHQELIAIDGNYARLVNAGRSEISPNESEKEDTSQIQRIVRPAPRAEPSVLLMEVEPAEILSRLLSHLNGSWHLVALSFLLGACTIGASVALMGTSAWLISTAALHPSIAELGVSIVGVRFFGISRGLFRYFERLVTHNVTFRLLAKLRTWFYEKLEPLAPARLMEQHAGDLLARIIGDVETLENFYVRIIHPPQTAVLVGLGTVLFLGSYNPILGLSLAGLYLIPGFLLPALIGMWSHRPAAEMVNQRAEIQSLLVDGVQGLADILAFQRAKDYVHRISSTAHQYSRSQQKMARIAGLPAGFSVLLSNLGMWMVLSLSIPMITRGELDGVMLAPITLLTLASFEAFTPVLYITQTWSSVEQAARRLFELVDGKPAVSGYTKETTIPSTASLRFEDVTFTYPGSVKPALEHITFAIQPGERIAIVGPSGGGKSTVVNLLFRFWQYSSGDILLGGTSLHDLDPDMIQAQYSAVPQNTWLFNTTIRENLRLAKPSMNQQLMEAAARAARIHDFISGLPQGYETFIGEQGIRISGGERQRLAIARAFLKDAPLFILDEPTANLDPLVEKDILDVLFEMTRGRTTLLITHRLVGLDKMDEILVMEHGHIVERGNHTQLLAGNGLYRRLLDLQNRILQTM